MGLGRVWKTGLAGGGWDWQEVRFQYNSGYWRVCRRRYIPFNESLSEDDFFIFNRGPSAHPAAVSWDTVCVADWPQFQRICLPNTFFRENVELGQLSGVTAAIMSRIQVSSIVHFLSLVGTVAATVLSVMGYARRDRRTLTSGILYISAGPLSPHSS